MKLPGQAAPGSSKTAASCVSAERSGGGGEFECAATAKRPGGARGRRMTRAEFDRSASRFAWPPGGCDARRGLVEVVAEPMPGHDSRARLAYDLVRAARGDRAYGAGALRIEWRGSAPEPDESFYFFDPGVEPGFGFDEARCPERGRLPPPPVEEIARSLPSARAAEERSDHFDPGVREIPEWAPIGGAVIYRRRQGAEAESVAAPPVPESPVPESPAPESPCSRIGCRPRRPSGGPGRIAGRRRPGGAGRKTSERRSPGPRSARPRRRAVTRASGG